MNFVTSPIESVRSVSTGVTRSQSGRGSSRSSRRQGAVDLVDEIWAISEFTRESIASATDKPVFSSPPPVVVPEVASDVDRSAFGLEDGRFVFLFSSTSSRWSRKNPLGLIDAFFRAFTDGEGPMLVIKTVNGESNPMDLEMVRLAAAGRSDVSVIDATVSAGELGALMQMTDCYVSLHRSEGFGLTMAESMILGKPVIATAYSGNLDFMTEQNSFLVPYSWAEVPRGAGPYPAGARWASPIWMSPRHSMRTVFEDPDLASRWPPRVGETFFEHHGTDVRPGSYGAASIPSDTPRITSGGSRLGSEKVGDIAGALSVSGVSDLVRRGVRRASGRGLARHTEDLGRAVSSSQPRSAH